MSWSWQTLVGFIVAICLLVSIHEYGHFWVARRLGFKVLRFSVGFGKALWKRTGRDGTEYQLAAIPLGGYVKLLDEREGPVAPEELSRAFTRRPHWQRIAVLLAGPAFNIIFAILVLTGMYLHSGVNEYTRAIGTVTAGSPAALAGLAQGDEVISVNGSEMHGQNEVFLALIDSVSARPILTLGVKGADGASRTVRIEVADADMRRSLTNPQSCSTDWGCIFSCRPFLPYWEK